jgi:hypothetical protein
MAENSPRKKTSDELKREMFFSAKITHLMSELWFYRKA